jgi:membrane carboxypeptidase/penicillin-binding protein
MSGEVARTVQQLLLAVVREGTATKADLATFDVAGKSGTARRTAQNEGYTPGNYTASFVGLFPGNDPQYVVLVKLDSPQGAHYAGGDIAAPVTQVVLRAALAARDAALDRRDLAASEKTPVAQQQRSGESTSRNATKFFRRGNEPAGKSSAQSYDPNGNVARHNTSEATTSLTVDLPASASISPKPTLATSPRPIPNVTGLSIREAVRVLHGAGFRVRLVATPSAGTFPAAGTISPPGTIVQLSRPVE